ncbi:MAG: hypothetical protein IJ106_11385 [Parasporobacterium sp.]|nr:hypothetical protein [Parasporobacterium sp.]
MDGERATKEDNAEYTITQLLEELVDDESWEADANVRRNVVFRLVEILQES